MPDWLWVALGGGAGSALRYGMAGSVQRWNGSDWPMGTLSVNVTGSFIIGLLTALILSRSIMSPQARLFFIVGALGGFTTFSTFSVETLRLIQQGVWWSALANVGVSLAGGLVAAWAGFTLAQLIWP